MRDHYKIMLLATQYGMRGGNPGCVGSASQPSKRTRCSTSTASCSRSTGAGPTIGCACAADRAPCGQPFGWTCRTGIIEFNERSIRNWPIQATGADILRIACILAARHGIKILAPVHDAVLIEAPLERIEADVARMRGNHATSFAGRVQRDRRWTRMSCAPTQRSSAIPSTTQINAARRCGTACSNS